MAHRRVLSSLVAGAGALALLLAACGGDDGGSAASDEEFCAELAALEEADAGSDGSDELDAEALSQLQDLADRAPDEELRTAIETLGDIAEQMSDLDEDDPEAFGQVMALMFDPEVISAGETLDTYMVDVCGMDPDETSGEITGEDASGDDGSGDDTDADDSVSDGSVSTFDALDSSGLNDGFEGVLDDLDVDSQGRSVGVSGGAEVTVVFDAAGVADADPVEVCEGVAALVDDALAEVNDPDPVTVEVEADGELVASRPDGGTCTAA
jgi:hypothetical protein